MKSNKEEIEKQANNKNKELLVFENDNNMIYENKTSLQDNFKKFLSMRKELRKSNLFNQTPIPETPSFRCHPERMAFLRKKFVDTAMTFLNIPYGKKYLEDHPDYAGDLFLDCCGLVRQTVNTLREDFGFMLGRWNQGYQFDLLPEKITFEQMKPGDLIFYSAIFYPEKGWKAQPHNMVHVEIYLGGENTPERTIAARDSRGVVEINETYQFTSENYYNIEYHFRSIDTWLKGIHKSFCDEHKWEDENIDYNTNKYSLFNVNEKDYQPAEELKEEPKK
jgi:hypothetical protein